MANGNPNQFCALLPTFGVEKTAGYQGSGWSMGTLDQWAVILRSRRVWKVDQETSGEARQWPGETWEAASWHVPRCPDAPENHWPVSSAGPCREQKAVASGCGRKCGVKVPHTSILSCFLVLSLWDWSCFPGARPGHGDEICAWFPSFLYQASTPASGPSCIQLSVANRAWGWVRRGEGESCTPFTMPREWPTMACSPLLLSLI